MWRVALCGFLSVWRVSWGWCNFQGRVSIVGWGTGSVRMELGWFFKFQAKLTLHANYCPVYSTNLLFNLLFTHISNFSRKSVTHQTHSSRLLAKITLHTFNVELEKIRFFNSVLCVSVLTLIGILSMNNFWEFWQYDVNLGIWTLNVSGYTYGGDGRLRSIQYQPPPRSVV